MCVISCFKGKSQVAAIDVAALVCTLMMNGDNISAQSCDDIGNTLQLTRLVDKLDIQQAGPSRLLETSFNNTAEDSNVDITA